MLRRINSNPAISVLMPAYNAQAYLIESISSVLSQTFNDFELIVINDGSTDGTRRILSSIKDARLRVITNGSNLGLIKSLMRGLSECRGNLVARMDADDVCMPDRFAKQASFMQANIDIDIVGGAISYIGHGVRPQTIVFPSRHEDIRAGLLFYCTLPHPALIFRRRLIDANIFAYSEEYRHAEDYHLWSQILQRIRAANLPDTVLQYRLHGRQVRSERSNEQSTASRCVRELMLTQAGVSATQVEFDLHERVVVSNRVKGWQQANSVAAWFRKIETANDLSGYWDAEALRQIFSDRCRQIVERNHPVFKRLLMGQWTARTTPELDGYLVPPENHLPGVNG